MNTLATVLAWIGGGGLVVLGLRWGIHRAFKAPRRVPRTDPGGFGLGFEDVTLTGAHDARLHAWYVPPPEAGAPCLAVIHGWGANAAVMLPFVAKLAEAGVGLLVIDPHNHGRSDDAPFSSMPGFAEDLSAGVDWLKARAACGTVGVLGHSVGAAAAILCAARRSDLDMAVALAPFAHPETTMRRFLAEYRVPYRPVGWAVNRYVERTIGHRFDDIAPANVIGRVHCPVLIVHGDADRAVPIEDARMIAARSGGRARLAEIAGADHFAIDKLDAIAETVADFVSSPDRSRAADRPD